MQKSTPKQIMLYQIALKLHKVFNEPDPVIRTETVRVFEQRVCSHRQLVFEVFKNNKNKIGLNTTANKLYHVNKLIGLNKVELGFVHFKKIMN